MATSGSYNFKMQRDGIIAAALRKLGVLGRGQTPNDNQITEGAVSLNVLVKKLQGIGVGLWALEWVTRTLTASTERTGTDGEVYTCIRGHVSATGDKPITGADFAKYWYKKGSTGGVWSAGATYRSIGDFDLDLNTLWVEKAFIRRANSDHDVDVRSMKDYLAEITKYPTGLTSRMMLDRNFEAMHAYLLPQPDKVTDVLHYQKYTILQDMNSGPDNPDFPPMWLDVLIFGLAHSLAFEYPSVPTSVRRDLRDEARIALDLARTGDEEVEFEPFTRSAYPEE
jgi:hypothetical protein